MIHRSNMLMNARAFTIHVSLSPVPPKQMGSIMSKEKKGTLAVKKEKKTVPEAKEPEPETIQDFNQMLDTLRSEIVWDPFRGFEWPVEYELPTRIPYVDVIDSGKEYVVKAELPGLKKENVEIEVGAR